MLAENVTKTAEGRLAAILITSLQMESLEKRLKASNEAKSRLAKDKKSMAAKTARTEGQR